MSARRTSAYAVGNHVTDGGEDRRCVLVATDSRPSGLEVLLVQNGYDAIFCSDAASARDVATQAMPDAILVELPRDDGIDLLVELGQALPEVPVVMLAQPNDVEGAVRAMRAGAADWLDLPAPWPRVELAIERAIARREVAAETESLRRCAEVTWKLADASLDTAALARAVVRGAVELLADGCALRLRDGQGALVTVATDHRHSTRRALLAAATAAALAPAAPPLELLERAENVLVRRVDDEEARAAVRDLGFAGDDGGVRSALCVPLRARGALVGALCLVRDVDRRPFHTADAHVARGLADEAALAFANARLFEDVTRELEERKRAEAALAEVSEKLRQATKLEALGRLASGVAHDFNNLISVILCAAEAVRSSVPAELAVEIDAIELAARSGADLTSKLLAFGRKQPHAPRVVDLGAELVATGALLRRVLSREIQLDLALGDDVGAVCIDPVQLQQVVMNLAINASDAMPSGGRLTMRTRREGEMAVLVVEDDGIGMAPEVRDRAFDPFFTTKLGGRGTGLGLATVLGAVHQSGGQVSIDSAPGEGTRVTVRLPRAS